MNADSRLLPNWLFDPKMLALSDSAWRVFTGSLIWCNTHGLDGNIERKHLRFVHPIEVKDSDVRELTQAGLWQVTELGFVIPDWAGSMGQSLGHDVDNAREAAKQRQRINRAKRKQAVTRDVLRDIGQDSDRTAIGQESDRQVRGGNDFGGNLVEDWPVTQPGSGAD